MKNTIKIATLLMITGFFAACLQVLADETQRKEVMQTIVNNHEVMMDNIMMEHMKMGKESMSEHPMMKSSEDESHAASCQSGKQKELKEDKSESPTDVLKKEHHLIIKMAEYAGTTATQIRGGESVGLEEVNQLYDFFKHFVDDCHHAKEEDFLFPMLKKLEVDPVTINLLIKQHEEGRVLLGGIAAILDKSEGSLSKADQKALAEYLSQYSQLMDRHIKLENEYLWPMASRTLDKDEKDELTKEFEQFEISLGEGFHEKYHSMAMKLMNESENE